MRKNLELEKKDKDPHRYDDIMDLSRPLSRKHRPMSMEARAAQFAPFAALTGYDEAVKETAKDFHFDDGVEYTELEDSFAVDECIDG